MNSANHTVVDVTVARSAAWLAKQVELGLSSVELSVPQYRVLSLLDEGDAAGTALAERLSVRPPSVTSIVDGLGGRGLVDRRAAEGDRRRVDHCLTEQGHATLARADGAVAERLSDVAGCLENPGEREQALDGLALWRSAMSAHYRARRSQP